MLSGWHEPPAAPPAATADDGGDAGCPGGADGEAVTVTVRVGADLVTVRVGADLVIVTLTVGPGSVSKTVSVAAGAGLLAAVFVVVLPEEPMLTPISTRTMA